jgi:hypothetical protein
LPRELLIELGCTVRKVCCGRDAYLADDEWLSEVVTSADGRREPVVGIGVGFGRVGIAVVVVIADVDELDRPF